MTNQVIPTQAVFRAGCTECDCRYYALNEARATNWADTHSDEEGHTVKVAALEGADND